MKSEKVEKIEVVKDLNNMSLKELEKEVTSMDIIQNNLTKFIKNLKSEYKSSCIKTTNNIDISIGRSIRTNLGGVVFGLIKVFEDISKSVKEYNSVTISSKKQVEVSIIKLQEEKTKLLGKNYVITKRIKELKENK